MLVLGETYLIKNWENFYKKYKILGRFHKINFIIFLIKILPIFHSIGWSRKKFIFENRKKTKLLYLKAFNLIGYKVY